MCCWAPALPRCPQLHSAHLRGALPCPTALCPDLGSGQPGAGPPPAATPLPAVAGPGPGAVAEVTEQLRSTWCLRPGPCRAPQPPAPLPLCRGGCPPPAPSVLPPAPGVVKGSKGLAGSPRLLPSRRPGRSPFPALLGVVYMPVLTTELVGGNLAAAVGTVVKCCTEIRACCIYHFSFCLL